MNFIGFAALNRRSVESLKRRIRCNDVDDANKSRWHFVDSFVIRHSDFVIATTTLSHRSHKSGCALLVPTVGRCRQQRAHFL